MHAYTVCSLADKDRDVDIAGSLQMFSENTSYRYLSLTDRLDQDSAISIAIHYLQFIKPITDYYTRWVQDDLFEKSGKGCRHSLETVLSNIETTRLTRATFRFQILCQIARHTDSTSVRSYPEATVRAFLDILDPWEIEELLCCYEFVHSVYDKVLTDLRLDLHPDNPKFEDQERPPTPDGAFDFNNPSMFSFAISLTGLLSPRTPNRSSVEYSDYIEERHCLAYLYCTQSCFKSRIINRLL